LLHRIEVERIVEREDVLRREITVIIAEIYGSFIRDITDLIYRRQYEAMKQKVRYHATYPD